MLVEFHSVVDAVQCAVEIQQRMARRNADAPADRRIEFRIGINLGDVVYEADDIFGDGVNVASRLQELAETGGICVSGAVREQMGGRLEVAFDDLGEKTVKNIARPIHGYRVNRDSQQPTETPAAEEAGRDGPSIAVLPFANMSGDPEQEFFVDGLTEDIITELSRYRELFVISRNSTFVYKGKAVKMREVAQELGAQYMVEGSVRKAGERIRVTVQLIDSETDRHVWAERYDRELADVFAIQDEVAAAIVATLPGRVEAARHESLKRKTTANMAAYECVLAGKVLHHRSSPEDNAEALRLLAQAIELDPNYAHAHAWRGCVLAQSWVHGWCEDRQATWEESVAEVDKALALDQNDADVHRILAAINVNQDNHERALYHQERALGLNPNYDLVVVQQGEILTWLGRADEGIEWIHKAMRLNPYHPERFWSHLGRACYTAGRYADAVGALMHLSAMNEIQHAFLAASYAQMGDRTAAKAHGQEVLTHDPAFTVEGFLATLHYKHDTDTEHCREGLTKAGLK